ncbi:MAG: 50S ribosomal protein L11 methyltransferase [Desulfobacterales bacterium]
MKWIKASVIFEAGDPETASFLIADIFYDLGLTGVITENPVEYPELDWADDALPAPENHSVTGFLPEDGRLDESTRKLEQGLAELGSTLMAWYRVEYSEVEEQDWAESWKAHFHPVKISEGIVIKPTWRDYFPQNHETVIELDPGMAFGTGTHPTTAMCLRLIERFMKPGFRVLDIGTGSGILMVAAARLGAGMLLGVDNDPVAVGVAEENLLVNGVEKEKFKLNTGNLVDAVTGTWDLAAANILTATIVPMIPQIPSVLAPGAVFIASGILGINKDSVSEALEKSGFEILEILSEDEWIGIAARKTKAS